MTPARCVHHGDLLYRALRSRTTIAPLTDEEPDLTIEDAYRVSLRLLERRLADGERVIGKKIGLTNVAVQRMFGVLQPDFGYLTDRMRCDAEVPISTALIQPRAEGEIAFVLRRDLCGPGISAAAVLDASECVVPCFEIVDSRIRDWKIRIQDTIADNASSGMFVLGQGAVAPRRVDLGGCRMRIDKNGAPACEGTGAAAALGSPADCVAWLANTLGALGTSLRAGEVILSGSLVPLLPVQAGERMALTVDFGGATGSASVSFA